MSEVHLQLDAEKRFQLGLFILTKRGNNSESVWGVGNLQVIDHLFALCKLFGPRLPPGQPWRCRGRLCRSKAYDFSTEYSATALLGRESKNSETVRVSFVKLDQKWYSLRPFPLFPSFTLL